MRVHLAPPLLSRKDANGHLIKREFGPWVFSAFKLVAALRGLRGTPFDLFGHTAERRMERQLIGDYERQVDELLGTLTSANVDLAAEIACIPEHIRGYGHVKHAHLQSARQREAELLARWRDPLALRLVA